MQIELAGADAVRYKPDSLWCYGRVQLRASFQVIPHENTSWQHWQRIAVTLIPLVFALLHAIGILPIGVLQRLDDIIYDARLRATMPKTLDERVVIVDIDEKSLAEVGRFPSGATSLGI
ncbi:CHASE2 domain-containing protein [Candidatus Aalborgicola defluviihabitans]|uniref:CHASE2 domain-containing protein n=1 Tax=Candidatus Aalborgicola defluviihabitans TaxID=3386187 RepID=UPI001D59BD64|nr:CHASE2 domain-containing protein [Burkholderiales bacterium]